MAREMRPEVAWAAVESLFSAPLFAGVDVSDLAVGMGKPLPDGVDHKVVAIALSTAAAGYAFSYWRQIQPPPSELSAQARSLSSACTAVLRSVGVFGPQPVEHGALFPAMARGGLYAVASITSHQEMVSEQGKEEEIGEAPSGQEMVLDALRAVEDIKRWAESLETIADKRASMAPPAKRGAPENRAFKILLADLTGIYTSAWDQAPGIPSNDEGAKRDHGFLHLLMGVASAIAERGIPTPKLTAEGIGKAWYGLTPEDKLKGFPEKRVVSAALEARLLTALRKDDEERTE